MTDAYQPLQSRYLPDSLCSPWRTNAEQCAINVATEPAALLIQGCLCTLQLVIFNGQGKPNEELFCAMQDAPAAINVAQLREAAQRFRTAHRISKACRHSSDTRASRCCVSLSSASPSQQSIATSIDCRYCYCVHHSKAICCSQWLPGVIAYLRY